MYSYPFISWNRFNNCELCLLHFQFKINKTLTIYPFLLHSLSMSVFSSVIGPFGGFFASGFKRAFKIKVWNFWFIDIFSFYWMQFKKNHKIYKSKLSIEKSFWNYLEFVKMQKLDVYLLKKLTKIGFIFFSRRILVIWFQAMVVSWIDLTVNFWWQHL